MNIRDIDPEKQQGQREEKLKRDRLAALEQDEDVRWLMSNRRGRNFAYRLLDVTGIYRTSFTGNSETFFKEGGRNVGLTFLNDLQRLTPDEYILMLKEHREIKPSNDSGGRAK